MELQKKLAMTHCCHSTILKIVLLLLLLLLLLLQSWCHSYERINGEIVLLGLEPKYLASAIGLCGVVPPRRTSVIFVIIKDVFHHVAFGIYPLIPKFFLIALS
jgi:hypothetical protein